jgi:hypothetical protein
MGYRANEASGVAVDNKRSSEGSLRFERDLAPIPDSPTEHRNLLIHKTINFQKIADACGDPPSKGGCRRTLMDISLSSPLDIMQ